MVAEGSSRDNTPRSHAAPDSPTAQNFPPERRSTSQTAPSELYVVTVGTFGSNENAQRLKSRFTARGKNVQITTRISDDQELYVVSMIGFQTVEAAKVEQQRLIADFPDCYIATIDTPSTRLPH
jgi:cell division protein FtsN